LIEPDRPVSTVAVGNVLAVYNWPAGTERYRKVTRFVQAFFYRPHDLQGPPYHAKWRAIDVTAPVLGWTRFAAAQDWIKKAGLDSNGPTRHARADEGGGKREAVAMSPQERNALFTQFDAYRKRQTAQLDSTGFARRAATRRAIRGIPRLSKAANS
jgi:uncharacterized protein